MLFPSGNPFKCHEEVLYLQPSISPKRFDIFQYTLAKTRHRVGYLLIYSVKRTQLFGRRPLSPCRVGKTAGYTLPRLLFSRTVPRFSETYPDLAGSGTLPSAIFSARITFRSQQRTPKPNFSCSKQAMNGNRHFLFLSLGRFCFCLFEFFFCSRWSFVDV